MTTYAIIYPEQLYSPFLVPKEKYRAISLVKLNIVDGSFTVAEKPYAI
jgi:hypothetical protein